MQGTELLFGEDMEAIIAECFDRLDITEEANLSVKLIRQGLLVNSRTHTSVAMKAYNKALFQHVFDMKANRAFGKMEFSQFVLTCLA